MKPYSICLFRLSQNLCFLLNTDLKDHINKAMPTIFVFSELLQDVQASVIDILKCVKRRQLFMHNINYIFVLIVTGKL